MPSLMMMTSFVSEDSLAREPHTDRHTHRQTLALVYLKLVQSCMTLMKTMITYLMLEWMNDWNQSRQEVKIWTLFIWTRRNCAYVRHACFWQVDKRTELFNKTPGNIWELFWLKLLCFPRGDRYINNDNINNNNNNIIIIINQTKIKINK